MTEVKTKHTVIVTIDKITLENARSDPYIRTGLKNILWNFRQEDGIKREDGGYYKYEVMA